MEIYDLKDELFILKRALLLLVFSLIITLRVIVMGIKMNPLDYTLFTLNAKCYLVEPEQPMVAVRNRSYIKVYGVFFLIGFLVGQIVHF
ncbi:hypothetical protein CGK03_24885 [Vibrio parahaemolyticus]|nr:hypothetical protein CGK03_24885 [Vibrio parahaemolyticus]